MLQMPTEASRVATGCCQPSAREPTECLATIRRNYRIQCADISLCRGRLHLAFFFGVEGLTGWILGLPRGLLPGFGGADPLARLAAALAGVLILPISLAIVVFVGVHSCLQAGHFTASTVAAAGPCGQPIACAH